MSVGAIMPHAQAGNAAARSNRVALEGASVNTPQAADAQADRARQAARVRAVQAAQESREAVLANAEMMDKISDAFGHRLSFDVHEGTGELVVHVVDSETGNVIRSVPSEEMLDIAQRIRQVAGMLFDHEG